MSYPTDTDPFEKYAIFNPDLALSQLAGRVSILVKVLNSFHDSFHDSYHDSDQDSEVMHSNSTEYQTLKNKLHTLKGLAPNLGLERLAHVSKAFEAMLKSVEQPMTEAEFIIWFNYFKLVMQKSLMASKDYCAQHQIEPTNSAQNRLTALQKSEVEALLTALISELSQHHFISEQRLEPLKILGGSIYQTDYNAFLGFITALNNQAAEKQAKHLRKRLLE